MRAGAPLAAAIILTLAWGCSQGAPRELSGPELAGRLECLACHSLHGQGGKQAAPLDGVGARLSPVELKTSLNHPRRRHPWAKMPSYGYLPPQEEQALLAYLAGLK